MISKQSEEENLFLGFSIMENLMIFHKKEKRIWELFSQ